MLELEAHSEMVSPKAEEKEIDCVYRNEGTPIVKVDLTADSPKESSPEVSVVTVRRVSHKSQKEEFWLSEKFDEGGLGNLSKLFDKGLLAQLITKDNWMDKLRKIIERNDRHIFELMGPFTAGWRYQRSSHAIIVANPGKRRC